jgi:uncharacterized protein YxeA
MAFAVVPCSCRQLHVEGRFLKPFEEAFIMKGLLALLVLLVIVIGGVGLYRGWFTVATENTDKKPSVSISMDKDKIKEDEEKVKEKVHDFGQSVKKETGDKADKVKEKEENRQP